MMDVFWECQRTPKEWTRYSADVSQKLNEEVEKSNSCELEIDSKKISFDFDQMKQKSGRNTKDIRCSVKNNDNFIFWEYQITRHRWISFSPCTTLKLERSKQKGIIKVILKDGSNTEVNFDEETMTLGENTTAIRRMLSDAVHVETESVSDTKPAPVSRPKRKKIVDEIENPDNEMVSKKANLEQVLKKAKKTKELSAEVDEYVPDRESKQVYIEKKDVYSVMLNQTNIAQNNNKFFLIQVLESKSSPVHYWAFFRWGRVGFKGQTNLIDCEKDLEKAKDTFLRKFFDKTLNEFKDRNKFQKVKGKYDLIQMDYSKFKHVPKLEEDDGESSVESKLDERIQNFLKLICDLKKMEEAARGLSYDINRAPLGKLTKSQIKAGYEALTRIEKCILSSNFNKEFKEAVDEYYTRIPHYFGMRVPSPIRDVDELKQELELLEVLSEIEAAVSSINQELKTKEKLHPIDQTYRKLKCDIRPLENDSERFKLIEIYLQRTHASNHDSYKMKLKSIYEVEKHGEKEKFKTELGNRRLLWHGSRLTNWHGILSRGLKIAPKEAPMTGYMFGKGVYFADMSSKSANYCYSKCGDTGVLVLAEVALGEMNPKLKADSRAAKLPEGKHSVQGVGDIGPNPSEFVTIDDGVLVPCGNSIEQEETKNIKNNDLYFNEYVVYNTDQIRLRYLVEVEFEPLK